MTLDEKANDVTAEVSSFRFPALDSLLHGTEQLETGLTIVTGPFGRVRNVASAAVILGLADDLTMLPVPVPKFTSITSIHSGPRRSLECDRMMHELVRSSSENPERLACSYFHEHAAIDWTSPAGSALLLQSKVFASGSFVVASQPEGCELQTPGLVTLRTRAEKEGVNLVLLCPDTTNASAKLALANETMQLRRCDPDPGHDFAFVIECGGRTNSDDFGNTSVYWGLRIHRDRLGLVAKEHVADDLLTRLMWLLKSYGWSLDKIGKALSIDKSNVSRRLRCAPAAKKAPENAAKIELWFKACGIDVPSGTQYCDDSVTPPDVAFERPRKRNTRNGGNTQRRRVR